MELRRTNAAQTYSADSAQDSRQADGIDLAEKPLCLDADGDRLGFAPVSGAPAP